jgi:hypothetical protein
LVSGTRLAELAEEGVGVCGGGVTVAVAMSTSVLSCSVVVGELGP